MTRMSDKSVGRLALGGLVSLVVLDVLLVALALRPETAEASPPAASASFAATPVHAASSAPPETTAAPLVEPAPVHEAIAAVDGKRAWRGILGSCRDGGASLSVTEDGGLTWMKRAAPPRAVGRFQPVAASRGFVIGAKDGACTLGEYSTGDDAGTWQGPRAVVGGWSRVPDSDHVLVITPQRTDARPCGTTPVVDLARVSAKAAVVVCADGRLVRSSDGGATWPIAATVKGALAVGAREVNGVPTVYVARVADGCAGVEVAKVAEGPATRIACVLTSLEGATGRVSLSVVGDGGWLGVAGATWRSDAKLETWRPTVLPGRL